MTIAVNALCLASLIIASVALLISVATAAYRIHLERKAKRPRKPIRGL